MTEHKQENYMERKQTERNLNGRLLRRVVQIPTLANKNYKGDKGFSPFTSDKASQDAEGGTWS